MQAQACTACAKARRRCGKEKPRCLRCRTRDIGCEYPLKKPSSFVAIVDDDPPKITACGPIKLDILPCLLSFPYGATLQETSWFSSPETWTIDSPPRALVLSQIGRFTAADLERLLKKTVEWLADWVEKGSNPFIHEQLYRHRLPRSIQDAYLSLSAYLHKTTANEHMIFRIIEERITQLVAEGMPSPNSILGGTIDALECLARVQTLLIYQCIGLYDGNVRLRYLAEQHIPLLESWIKELNEHISRHHSCGESLVTPVASEPSQNFLPAPHIPSENILWYTYILTESVRRTWLVTAGVQGIYKLIQGGEASCMGGTIFTTRSGFWEAKSAVAWEKRCCEVYAGLLRLTEVDKMLTMVPRDEISDFAKVVMACTYGAEQTERWGVGAY
jgi:hypothetical protein